MRRSTEVKHGHRKILKCIVTGKLCKSDGLIKLRRVRYDRSLIAEPRRLKDQCGGIYTLLSLNGDFSTGERGSEQ